MRLPCRRTSLARCALLLAACTSDVSTARQNAMRADAGATPADASTAVTCSEARFCVGTREVTQSCATGTRVDSQRDCAALGLGCHADVGCSVCAPKIPRCDANNAMVCRADGSGYDLVRACDVAAGQLCADGLCTNACAAAESGQSYIGCEYWPTPVLNSLVDSEFEFAAIVSNPQSLPVRVTITLGASEVEAHEIPAGGVRAITLPWIPALKGTPAAETSALLSPGAYRLRSNLPVTVYQFNPLEYHLATDCMSEANQSLSPDGECFSMSNDASLLLPTHALAEDYIVISRPTIMNQYETRTAIQTASNPGFFTVVGADPMGVDVTITVRAHVVASTDGVVGALAPGGTATYHLAQGDVLQVVAQAPTQCTASTDFPPEAFSDTATGMLVQIRTFCVVGPEYDLTGSEVHATGKVAVTSGHNCAYVPYGRTACDHLEEQLFPLQSWGQDYLVSITRPLRQEPNIIRIISGDADNQIHFEPPVHSDVTLDRGGVVEFEAKTDFRVTGSKALLVAQFLVGQDFAGPQSSGAEGMGDPSFSLAIPVEQYRTSYSVLVPETYPLNLLNVTIDEGKQVTMDGQPIVGFVPVPGTSMATARIEVEKGQHDLKSDTPFGLVGYGFGRYTSYMYPAGLDFKRINKLQ